MHISGRRSHAAFARLASRLSSLAVLSILLAWIASPRFAFSQSSTQPSAPAAAGVRYAHQIHLRYIPPSSS